MGRGHTGRDEGMGTTTIGIDAPGTLVRRISIHIEDRRG